MTLPTLDKTWQFNVNNSRGNVPPPSGSNTEDHKDIMFMIKQSLIGETFEGVSLGWTGTWSVESSSPGDGTFGAGDNWANKDDVVWANTGTNHSWIVFRQSATGTEFCVDCDYSDRTRITITWSPADRFGAAYGGTDGTATDRPTATDEIFLINNSIWFGSQTGRVAAQVHTMISTDGECTRVCAQIQNTNVMFWLFDLAKNPVSGWANPAVAMAISEISAANCTEWTDLNEGTAKVNGVHGAINMTMYMTTEGIIGFPTLVASYTVGPNDIDGTWPMFPVGLVSETSGARGRHGELFDFWFGPEVQPSGATYPDNLTRQFVHIPDLILPWNGSAPKVIG